MQQPLPFRLRKVMRYIRLYGLRRTAVKVRAHYHMKKRYASLPSMRDGGSGRAVGIIGCGRFAFSHIAYYLRRHYGNVIRGAMDIDVHRAASLCEQYRADYYTDDPDRVITDPDVGVIYIASNHASHAEYAIKALAAGKCVHIEKPHVVNSDQLERLCAAMAGSRGKVRIGFNRPQSRIGEEIRRQLDAQPGAAMLNWFIAGHEIPSDHWYYREEEGGRILGNLCHWTDFVYQMVSPERRYPILINPTRAENVGDDMAVTYVFGDGTIAAITFSVKGHAFEGVRERFAAHRGDALISMDDFQRLVVDVVERKDVISLRRRDHGHGRAIARSYEMVRPKSAPVPGLPVSYVWGTGDLFLNTRKAVETGEPTTVYPYSEERGTADVAS